MAKYTMELRTVINIVGREEVENWFKDYELSDYLSEKEINTIYERGTWNKDQLAKRIVDTYYMREIGFETIGLFKHYVMVTMEEIMESKLPLIYSMSIKYDPLVNVDYTETYKRDFTNDTESKDSTNTNSSGLTVTSDTPQGQISKAQILAGNYASNTSAGESEALTNGISSGNSTIDENYTKNVKGNSGVSATAQKMIVQYRENIRAVNLEIIKELNTLFMGLY